jgi:ATP-dependent DNA helicase DinG
VHSFLEDIADVFSESGTLTRIVGFEHRPQQEQMAVAIAEALSNRTHLMVEAPTGVGKTLAYLIPTALFAIQQNRRVIVSTNTKNLQDQLFRKDLPIAQSLIREPISTALVKGRRNYCCSTRLRNALAAPPSLFGDDVAAQLAQIARWEETSPDGDLESLPFTPSAEVWDMVCSERGVCTPAACGSSCAYQRLRERNAAADVIVMNHALFFTLMGLHDEDQPFPGEDDVVVFDEAHMLAAVAAAGIGQNLSKTHLLRVIHRLYNPATKRGLLGRRRRAEHAVIEHLESEADAFFDRIGQAARAQRSGMESNGSTVRIRHAGIVVNTLEEPLREAAQTLAELEKNPRHSAIRQELALLRESFQQMSIGIGAFLEQSDESLTYWVEFAGDRVALCSSAADPSEILGRRLFREGSSVILTSATLAVDQRLDYACAKIGMPGLPGMMLDTPFDFARQMRLSLVADIPEPDSNDYASSLPEWILRSIDRTHGRALVLFTSASLMNTVAREVRQGCTDRGIELFVQGVELPRHELLQRFRDDIHSVLFGLDSFWTGIDVPGEALEHVIITRLPFAVPNHPLIEARLEAIARRGGNAFMEFTLPEAVLKFRQGVGRLIRTTRDRGMVTILDSRILRKRYGEIFLRSLPVCPVELMLASGETEILTRE